MNKIYCKKQLNVTTKRDAIKSYFDNDSPETYDDKECTMFQCRQLRRRSAGDLAMLLNGLFEEETSIEDTILLLVDMVTNDECRALFCPDIRKVVFFDKCGYSFNGPQHIIYSDKSLVGSDGYSWNSMLEIYKTKQNERKNK